LRRLKHSLLIGSSNNMTLIQSLVLIISASFALSSQAASVWKVSSDQHSLYIGGTIHILTPEDYPLPKEYDVAYKAADKLIFETDMQTITSPAFGQKMMAQLMYNDGTTINEVLNQETYKALAIHMSSRQIPMQVFASHKPSLISVSLTLIELQALGYTSEGVDQFYTNLAIKEGKPQNWLETPDQQLSFIVNMGKDDPNGIIEYTLKDIEKMPEIIGELHSTWRSGNMPGMAEVGITPFKTDYPQLYQDLIVTRNNTWMPKIITMLNDETTEFILVGALHLAGTDSVLRKLEAKGYKIEKL
jgi:uncharacterized protein YbaP (TraB family)